MKIEDLDELLVDKILSYVPLKDIFTAIRYTSHKFKDLSEYYTNPIEICTSDFQFMKVSQLCELIKQSTRLRNFRIVRGPVYATVFEHLSIYAVSLRSLKLSFCMQDWNANNYYDALEFLLACGHEFEEIIFNGTNLGGLGSQLLVRCLFPTLHSMRKLVITGAYINANVLTELLNACPNLTYVSLRVFLLNNDFDYNVELGPQIKELHYTLLDNNRLIENLEKFAQLKTLGIGDDNILCPNVVIPYLPNVAKFTLGFNMNELGITPSQISKSLPNLKEITYQTWFPLNNATISFITSYPYLRKISIISPCTKNNLLSVFKQCKHIRFAKFSVTCLIDLSEKEAKEHFSGLSVIDIIYSYDYDEIVIQRLACWLPSTKIFKCTFTRKQEVRDKICAESCKFSGRNIH